MGHRQVGKVQAQRLIAGRVLQAFRRFAGNVFAGFDHVGMEQVAGMPVGCGEPALVLMGQSSQVVKRPEEVPLVVQNPPSDWVACVRRFVWVRKASVRQSSGDQLRGFSALVHNSRVVKEPRTFGGVQ